MGGSYSGSSVGSVEQENMRRFPPVGGGFHSFAGQSAVGRGGALGGPLSGGGAQWTEAGPQIMQNLQRDFGLNREQAAGVLGNLGHESTGFTQMQERGGGGWGIAQWTGSRRRQFMAYARAHGFAPSSLAANYGFLKHELSTNYAGTVDAVKRARGAGAAMHAFEQHYERAGVKAYGNRAIWTRRALDFKPGPGASLNFKPHTKMASRPVQVQTSINVDGRELARATSTHIARDMQHSRQSPYFNGQGMFAGPDTKFAVG